MSSDTEYVEEPAIWVENLERRFGSLKAVDGISFSVERGKVVGFIGANGAGKTTTMRILSTLDVPDSGTVKVMGYDVVSQAAEVRRCLGWMPDAFGKYKNLDVREYLDFFARAYGLKGDLRRRRMQEVSEFTELDRIANSPVFTLSKGQSQRLSLARTLLNDPAVLILDEPAAGLDPKARVELKRLVRLLASMGKTLFISSHILSELDEVCDSLLFIEDGKVLFQGKSDDLKGHSGERALVEIETEGDPAALMAWLNSHPSVQVDREAGQTCFVSLDPAALGRRGLLRSLIADDIPIVGFRKTERKLEEAFIHHLKVAGERKVGS